MTFVDTHSHIHDPTYSFPANTLEKALKQGVKKVIAIGTDIEDSQQALAYAKKHKGVSASVGIYPTRGGDPKDLLPLARDKNVVAIGEAGLDYYRKHDKTAQRELLIKQIEIARKVKKPMIFHCRSAFDDFFDIIGQFPNITGVVHSFSGGEKELKKALSLGLYLGINGMATYYKIAFPPLSNMILETDAPFLFPRFKPKQTTLLTIKQESSIINTSGNIPVIAEYIAMRTGVELAEVAKTTTKNAEALFGI